MLALGRLASRAAWSCASTGPGGSRSAPLMGLLPRAARRSKRLGAVLLYVGLALALAASVLYVRDGRRQVRAAQRG